MDTNHIRFKARQYIKPASSVQVERTAIWILSRPMPPSLARSWLGHIWSPISTCLWGIKIVRGCSVFVCRAPCLFQWKPLTSSHTCSCKLVLSALCVAPLWSSRCSLSLLRHCFIALLMKTQAELSLHLHGIISSPKLSPFGVLWPKPNFQSSQDSQHRSTTPEFGPFQCSTKCEGSRRSGKNSAFALCATWLTAYHRLFCPLHCFLARGTLFIATLVRGLSIRNSSMSVYNLLLVPKCISM